MIQKIPYNRAVEIMLVLVIMVSIFHLAVLFQLIPFTAVWGGRLQSVEEMMVFESASILINFLLLVVVQSQLQNPITPLPDSFTRVVLWIFVIIFLLNTIGNLFAENIYEKLIATPLTLISAILCYRIVKENKSDPVPK